MTTLNFPIRRPAASQPVQRSTKNISDAELEMIGVRTPAQRAVYRIIRSNSIRHESEIARLTGIGDVEVCKAVNSLMSANLVRRGQAPLCGLYGPFELIEPRTERKTGAAF